MKHLKMLALAAFAAGALMASIGAGTASATELTCSAGAMCPETTIHATSEGHVVLDSLAGKIECNSTVEGTPNTGSSTVTVSSFIPALTFTGCTHAAVVVVFQNGRLEAHTEKTTPNGNGTLTSSGTQVTVELFGVHCIYETNQTDLGTITGSATTGAAATVDISATIPRIGGRSGAFCGSSAPWTGSYAIDSPMYLSVD